MPETWCRISAGTKGFIVGVTTVVMVNLLLYFFTYGWFSYGIGFVGPFISIAFGAMIGFCIWFANTPKKETE